MVMSLASEYSAKNGSNIASSDRGKRPVARLDGVGQIRELHWRRPALREF